ncbi:unnamed protein product [Rhizophagus irregularis]|nr:unnamed protein product [Rhizophagus irregularis]
MLKVPGYELKPKVPNLMELTIAETSQLQQLRAEILGELDKDENNLYSEKEEENINEDENLNNKKSSA